MKKAIRESNGKNITQQSNVKEVWNSINDILKPENISKNTIKIETETELIEDPLKLAEHFNNFFKEKVQKLAAGIRKNPKNDPFSRLKVKLQNSDLKFALRTQGGTQDSKDS